MVRFSTAVTALALGAARFATAQTENIAQVAQSNGFTTLLTAVGETPFAPALSDAASDLSKCYCQRCYTDITYSCRNYF